MIKYEFLARYQSFFVYLKVKCNNERYQLGLQNNTVQFKRCSIDLIDVFSEAFNWNKELKIAPNETFYALASHLKKKYHKDISITMLKAALPRLEDNIFGHEITKICQCTDTDTEYDAFVKFIYNPEFVSLTDAGNAKVFDYIDICVSLNSYLSFNQRKYIVNKFKRRILQDILDKLSSSRSFTTYKVPINTLKFDKITLLKNKAQLVVSMKLKDIPSLQEQED